MDDLKSLIISTELPSVPMTGGRIRTDRLARALAQLGPVTIAGFTLEGEPARLAPPLLAAGVPWTPPPLYARMESDDPEVAASAYEQLASRVPEPWIASGYESARLRDAIRTLCDERVDLVVVEHSLMAAYLEEVPSHVPTVLDLHNVHWREAERASQRGLEDPAEAQRVRTFEARAIGRCTMTLAVSEVEAAAVQEVAPEARVEVVPNGVDVSSFTPGATPPTPGYVLFTGLMNYRPNVEAVWWFSREILPLLDEGVLHIVGSRPSEEVRALASSRVQVHGEVADTRPFQWQAQVVVIPVLAGAGTRLKLLEAAACGNAIVSTTLGAEGLDLVAGRDLLIADSPEEFADAVRAVLSDGQLRTQLGHNARSAAERYRWELITDRFLELVRPLTSSEARRAPVQLHAS